MEMASLNPILELKDMSLFFGGIKANQNVSISLVPGKLYGLIGPNGAGKSTIFNVITGIYKPTKGEVLFHNENTKEYAPFDLAQKGIGRTFQNIRLFKDLTVEENVMTSFFSSSQTSFVQNIFQTKAFKDEEENNRKKAFELLKFM